MKDDKPILVAGATGYVGGRLIPALLEFKIHPIGNQYTDLEMLSRFLPKGLWGMLYWYSLYPFHEKIFFGMLKAISKTIGKSIVSGPERFTPRLHGSCVLPS